MPGGVPADLHGRAQCGGDNDSECRRKLTLGRTERRPVLPAVSNAAFRVRRAAGSPDEKPVYGGSTERARAATKGARIKRPKPVPELDMSLPRLEGVRLVRTEQKEQLCGGSSLPALPQTGQREVNTLWRGVCPRYSELTGLADSRLKTGAGEARFGERAASYTELRLPGSAPRR